MVLPSYCVTFRVGDGISFRKIPRNRLGTVSVIPRKKALIPRHSEFRGRANSEARNGTERNTAEKNSFTKQQQNNFWIIRVLITLQWNTYVTSAHYIKYKSMSNEFFPGIPFRSVPSFGIGSSAEVGMPRNECFLSRNNGNRSESIPRNFFGTKFRSQPYLFESFLIFLG